jgi:putative MATE family efflux protein
LNFPLIATLFGVTATAAVGTQILVAQRVGSGDESGARRLVFNGAVLSAFLGAALLAVALVAGGPLVRLLGATPAVAPSATAYLVVFASFFPLAATSDAIERGFVGWGDTRATLYINLAMVGTNVVLDPLLILGYWRFPALGVEGAALATGIGYAVGLLAAVGFAVSLRDTLSLSAGDARLSVADLRALVDVGAPVSGQQLAGQSARVAIVGVVVTVSGAAGLAAYTVGARVATVAFVPASGFGGATQSMVGQNVGDGRTDRAHGTVRIGVAIAAGTLGAVGVVQWLAPGFLATLFVPTLSAVGFERTVDYLAILAYGYPAMGASAVLLAAFNGASRTRTSFVVDLLKYWAVRIPAAVAALPAAAITIGGFAVGGLDWGIYAVFWVVTVSNVLAAVGLGEYYLLKREPMFSNAAAEAADAADAAAGSD